MNLGEGFDANYTAADGPLDVSGRPAWIQRTVCWLYYNVVKYLEHYLLDDDRV